MYDSRRIAVLVRASAFHGESCPLLTKWYKYLRTRGLVTSNPGVGVRVAVALNNLVMATGQAMIGISLGPITGKLVAQLVYNGFPEIELSQLSLPLFV